MSQSQRTMPQGSDRQDLLFRLERAQRQFGHISEEAIAELAQSLDISIGDIYGVTTFYSFLSTQPLGQNVIRVCQSLPCYLKNSQQIVKCVEEAIGIKPGEMTPDGQFSLVLTNCIGACDQAPAMLINDDLHGNLTPAKISQILKSYKQS